MDRIKRSGHFSLLSLLPWLLLALAIEQGTALSFYPDSNFSRQTELVEQTATNADYHLQLEKNTELNRGNYTSDDTAFLAILPTTTGLLALDSSSTFVHLHYQNLLITWMHSRSLPYQLS